MNKLCFYTLSILLLMFYFPFNNSLLNNFFSSSVQSKTTESLDNFLVEKRNFKKTEVCTITIPKSFKFFTDNSNPTQNLEFFLKKNNALIAINGGYFNYSDGKSVSHIIKEGLLIGDPNTNKDLINNKELKPIIDKIINKRSEFRVIKKGNKFFYTINFRDIKEENIFYSLQAGPQLLPEPELEKEGFIIKNKKGEIIRDGISSQSKASRSAIGIKNNGDIILVSCSGKENQGLTIKELSELMKKLDCKKAMNLDGGTSVSMVWKNHGKIEKFIGKINYLPHINSALLITN